MKSRMLVAIALGLLGLAVTSGDALARNPNCAGGIQYLSQAMKDKERGNIEDYKREISKAVQRLEMCSSEDPNDFEAIGYLAWAYAEVDSACPAGDAFKRAVEGLKTKGDKKKVSWVENNRESYWATKFNEGIKYINDAQTAYPDYAKEAANDEEKALKAEAGKLFGMAIASLSRAGCLKPGDPRTVRNLGTAHAFLGDYPTAEAILKQGVESAPTDSDMVATLRSVRNSAAARLVAENKYDEAITYYEGLVKEPEVDSGTWMGLADAHFKRAQAREGDPRKADFKAACTAFAKASALKPEDADLPFNAALACQNAGDHAGAEAQWRKTLQLRPDDPDAESALGATLAELKKFDEAIGHVHRAVTLDSKNKARHRQLAGVYTKAGDNAKATEELMVFLALQNGKAVADVSGQVAKVPGGSDADKTNRESGTPEEIYLWEGDGEHYESWFYWAKHMAQHFKGGTRVQRSDWSTAVRKSATAK